jgi:hypothetical protein
MTLIVSPSLRQPIDVGSYGDASLWCARPKDSCGIGTHTFKSDWYAPYTSVPPSATHSSSLVLMTPSRAHCFPLSFQPYVLKNQTKLYQTSRADAQTSSARQGANALPHRITRSRPGLTWRVRLGRKVTLMSHTGRFLRLRENGEAFTSTWAGTQDHTSG